MRDAQDGSIPLPKPIRPASWDDEGDMATLTQRTPSSCMTYARAGSRTGTASRTVKAVW